jgi:type II restriction enzyme
MNYGIESGQSDKAFAANGNVTSKYLRCARLQTPIIKKSEIKNIILNGGEKKLQPERRLDQTIFFTMQTTSNT